MQKKETSIEVKVGALVLFSLTLLVGFVLILGDFSFSDGFKLHVDFDNAGGLKPGAEVAIAGINVGNVQELNFQPNENADDGDKPAVGVRATLRIDKAYAGSLRVDNKFASAPAGCSVSRISRSKRSRRIPRCLRKARSSRAPNRLAST